MTIFLDISYQFLIGRIGLTSSSNNSGQTNKILAVYISYQFLRVLIGLTSSSNNSGQTNKTLAFSNK